MDVSVFSYESAMSSINVPPMYETRRCFSKLTVILNKTLGSSECFPSKAGGSVTCRSWNHVNKVALYRPSLDSFALAYSLLLSLLLKGDIILQPLGQAAAVKEGGGVSFFFKVGSEI